ncbi:MAG: PHB depolymerase family esterase, partial [Pseudomonadota bacterium]
QGELHRDQKFVHDGKERSYHHYQPDAADPRPLVLLLHGAGAKIDTHIGLDGTRWPHQVWLQIADEDKLHLLVPQGLDSHWNDCRAECQRCGDEDDLGFLLALLDDLAARHAVDLQRVYVAGESNGGFMAQRLAQEAPARFAAIGAVIALMPASNDCTPQDVPMPLMYQVGSADAEVLYQGGASDPQVASLSAVDSVAYWRSLNHCETTPALSSLPDLDPEDGSTARREDYACADTGASLALIALDGAGHVPPSVEVEVSLAWEALAGRQNHDVEGAREFWAFFKGRLRVQ